MIEASAVWKDIQQRFLLPETYVEIDCAITEMGLQEDTSASGTKEAIFSEVDKMRGVSETTTTAKYATLEHNLWALDGTRSILPDKGPYSNVGYASDIDQSGSVTLTLSKVHTVPIPGVAITWSSEYDEYPPVFTVTARNGSTGVAEVTVTDNASSYSVVDMELAEYDSVTVTIHNWSLPNRRGRIDDLFLGHILAFTKKEIISYTHTQHGDLLTGEIPKYGIEFTVDNTDGRWNPSNPTGLQRYLSERQKVSVRYGLDIGGTIEWIKAGTFYLSEWSAPSNGMEAQFAARDVMEFLLSAENQSAMFDTLKGLVENVTRYTLPEGAVVSIASDLANDTAEYLGDGTAAEIVQKCANAACCILRYGRDGILHIEPLSRAPTGYMVPLSLAYSHPEITLSKPLKTVSVDYGAETPLELHVFPSGEVQTVSNSFITKVEQAGRVAEWVRDMLSSRQMVTGEFRADPRLDLYDVVMVESKFGILSPVVLTEVKYEFNGAFRASYAGRILPGEAIG